MTAEEFLVCKLGVNGNIKLHQLELDIAQILVLMNQYGIEKAKHHVTEALKAAQRRHGETQTYEPEHSHIVNYAILTAYPLENIK